MTKKAFIIIDMQRYFEASRNENLKKNIIDRINHHIDIGSDIYLVEFVGCGKTYSCISKPVFRYKNHYIVYKDDENGGPELTDMIENMGKKYTELEFCGVCLEMCVLATVRGVKEYYDERREKVNIVLNENCCNQYYDCELKDYILEILPKIKII